MRAQSEPKPLVPDAPGSLLYKVSEPKQRINFSMEQGTIRVHLCNGLNLISSQLSIQVSVHHYRKITLFKYKKQGFPGEVNLENRFHIQILLLRVTGICPQYRCHDFCITICAFTHMNLYSACHIMSNMF